MRAASTIHGLLPLEFAECLAEPDTNASLAAPCNDALLLHPASMVGMDCMRLNLHICPIVSTSQM